MIVPLSQPVEPYNAVLLPTIEFSRDGDRSMITEHFTMVGANLTKDGAYVMRISPVNNRDSYTNSNPLSEY